MSDQYTEDPAKYRYILTRSWIGTGGLVNFLMLNPSIADATKDDPTIRKCVGFAKRWGFSGIVVTNLFAMRATKPVDLWRADFLTALGEEADTAIDEAARAADLVVVAWGAHQKASYRANAVMNLVIPTVDLYCIGRSKDGHPLHPCMAAYTDAPVIFRGRS